MTSDAWVILARRRRSFSPTLWVRLFPGDGGPEIGELVD